MQLLKGPTALHETRCQIVEQLRIYGRIGPETKVAWSTHQGRSEMVHPDPVDNYSAGRRVVRVDDRFGQFQAAASVLERLAFIPGNNLEKPGWRFFARPP